MGVGGGFAGAARECPRGAPRGAAPGLRRRRGVERGVAERVAGWCVHGAPGIRQVRWGFLGRRSRRCICRQLPLGSIAGECRHRRSVCDRPVNMGRTTFDSLVWRARRTAMRFFIVTLHAVAILGAGIWVANATPEVSTQASLTYAGTIKTRAGQPWSDAVSLRLRFERSGTTLCEVD